jgi:hypothetical protein
MRGKTRRQIVKSRPFRNHPDDIDGILEGYGSRARVVQIWRQVDGTDDQWTYMGRITPDECEIELIGARFGGGWYRARIFGGWDRDRRQEEYLEQVTFGLDEYAWPMTAETLGKIRAHAQR